MTAYEVFWEANIPQSGSFIIDDADDVKDAELQALDEVKDFFFDVANYDIEITEVKEVTET